VLLVGDGVQMRLDSRGYLGDDGVGLGVVVGETTVVEFRQMAVMEPDGKSIGVVRGSVGALVAEIVGALGEFVEADPPLVSCSSRRTRLWDGLASTSNRSFAVTVCSSPCPAEPLGDPVAFCSPIILALRGPFPSPVKGFRPF
jgi:hypothetical protein